MSIAAGPLGRNLEGTGSLSSKGSIAAMYSYSRSKGLFGGASVEGAIIVERSDANSKAYGQNVTATQLLSGAIDPPPWADTLISTITRLTHPQSSSSYSGYDDPYGRLPIEGDEDSDSDDDSRGGRREQAPTGGYAFGSAYAAGGSSGAGGFSPEREKSRISSMLGSVGRSRSGSGGSKGGRGEAEDPFASQTSFGASGGGGGNGGGGGGGPKVGGEARFATQFSRLEDDSDDGYSRPSFPSSSTAAGSSPALNSSTSTRPKPPTTLSRENSFGLSGLGGSGGGAVGGGGKTKLTKTKARSGSANSAGLRERAGQMSWGGGSGDGGRERDSFDSLDDEREQYRRFGGTAEEWTGGAGAKEKKGGGMMGRFRSSTYSSSSSPVTAFDPSALSSSTSSANTPNAPKQKSRLRSSTAPSSKKSPFDDDSDSGSFSRTTTRDSLSSSDDGGGDSSFRPGLNRALSKPWDSEDESYFAAPPSLKPHQAAPYASYSPSRPATTALPSVAPGARTPGGHTPLDLREVEADFATAMDLARNGGEAEVGSYSAGTRSRSSTVTAGGGRSRSGTVTAAGLGNGGLVHGERERPAGVGKDGIGWAVGLFDFPGVESTDLPFLKNDLLTLLNRDDAEWWRARKGLREGMVPRNYLEAHFD